MRLGRYITAGVFLACFSAQSLHAQGIGDYNPKGYKIDLTGYNRCGNDRILFIGEKTVRVDSEVFCSERRGKLYRLIAPNENTFGWMEWDSIGLVQTVIDEKCAGGPFTKRYRGSGNFPIPECAVNKNE